MDGGHLIAETLKQAGVTHVFTLCGGHVMNIYDGCLERGIRVIDVRHEQAAAMAADGWARVTGTLGVAIVTAGPGVTNAFTGLENARRAESPVLCMGGQAPLETIDRGALQETEHLSFVAPVTKMSRRVHTTARLAEYVDRAIRSATSLPMGPAYLELPWDVLFGDTAAPAPRPRTSAPRAAPDPTAVKQAADALRRAERPILLVGSGFRWGAAWTQLRQLCRDTRIPTFLNGLARGSLEPDHPALFHLSRGAAMKRADLVANLYAPWDFRLAYGEKLAPDARIVHAAETPDRVGINKPETLGLTGHPALVVEALQRELKGWHAPKAWIQELQSAEEQKAAELQPAAHDGPGLHALELCKAWASLAAPGHVLIGDGGNIVATAAKLARPATPEHWMDTGPFGCLGVGPPFALAAGLSGKGLPVLLEGDGSFGLNGFELETMARHNVPALVLVANDGSWSQIRVPQAMMFGSERTPATGLTQAVRYDRIAEGMGCVGRRVEAAKELEAAIEDGLRETRRRKVPVVLDVLVDPGTNEGTGSSPY